VRTPLVVPVTIGAFFGVISTRLPVGDSDVFWHLAIGHDTLARGLASTDAYSWTVRGLPISVDQWLGQVLWALADEAGGWRGIVALRAFAIALLVGVIVYAALRERPARPLGAVLAALPAIALSRFVWTERPELFGFICFAVLIVLLRTARSGSDVALYWMPPLIVLWANLHGSFALGAGLIVLVAIEGAIAQPSRRRMYGLAAIGSLVATLVTPANVGAWTAPGYHLLHPPREIQEWSVPDVTTLPGAIFALAIFATFVTAFCSRARAPREGVVLLPVLFLSLIATRQMPLFAIATAPYLAAHGGDALAELARSRDRPAGWPMPSPSRSRLACLRSLARPARIRRRSADSRPPRCPPSAPVPGCSTSTTGAATSSRTRRRRRCSSMAGSRRISTGCSPTTRRSSASTRDGARSSPGAASGRSSCGPAIRWPCAPGTSAGPSAPHLTPSS
jgi:hypothetical protein